MDSKAYLQLGAALAKGLAEGAAEVDRFGAVYRAAMIAVEKATHPIRKMRHYAKHSKRARIRKKYQKRLEWLARRGFNV